MEDTQKEVKPVQQFDKLAAALAKAQGKITNPPKNRTVTVQHKAGGKHSYSYCTLDALLDHVRKPLSDEGLSIVQFLMPGTSTDKDYVLITRLMHSSGQYIESTYPIPYGLDEQDKGKAITYGRRYTLAPMVGVSAETDTDANSISPDDDAAEDKRKAEAEARLEAMKAQGRIKSANTGEVLKPKAETTPPAEPEKKPEPKPEPEDGADLDFRQKKDEKEESSGTIDKRLMDLFAKDHIGIAQFKKWGVSKGNFTEDMDLSKLREDFILAIIKQWEKVKQSIRKAV